jgi:GT2 family glycosyltransferase
MDHPLIAVIILNWNGWRDTAACVCSLSRSTYPNHRILVVDNGSEDNSVAALRREIPTLEILENGHNLGFGRGANAGITYALRTWAPSFVWLLNNDTLVHPETMTELAATAVKEKRVGAVGAVILDAGGRNRMQEWGGKRMGLFSGVPLDASKRRPPRFISGASMLLRTQCLEECGLFDPGYFFYMEDADLCFRLAKKGWRLAVAEKAMVLHKGSASIGAQTEAQAYWYRRGLIRFLRTHAPLPWLPVLTTTVARLIITGLTGNRAVLRGTWRGFWDAFFQGENHDKNSS